MEKSDPKKKKAKKSKRITTVKELNKEVKALKAEIERLRQAASATAPNKYSTNTCDTSGTDTSGTDTSSTDTSGTDSSGTDTSGTDTSSIGTSGNFKIDTDTSNTGKSSTGTSNNGTSGTGTSNNGTSGNDKIGTGTSSTGTSGNDKIGTGTSSTSHAVEPNSTRSPISSQVNVKKDKTIEFVTSAILNSEEKERIEQLKELQGESKNTSTTSPETLTKNEVKATKKKKRSAKEKHEEKEFLSDMHSNQSLPSAYQKGPHYTVDHLGCHDGPAGVVNMGAFNDMMGTSPFPLDGELLFDPDYADKQLAGKYLSSFVDSTLKPGDGVAS